jgi:hypothetical protein
MEQSQSLSTSQWIPHCYFCSQLSNTIFVKTEDIPIEDKYFDLFQDAKSKLCESVNHLWFKNRAIQLLKISHQDNQKVEIDIRIQDDADHISIRITNSINWIDFFSTSRIEDTRNPFCILKINDEIDLRIRWILFEILKHQKPRPFKPESIGHYLTDAHTEEYFKYRIVVYIGKANFKSAISCQARVNDQISDRLKDLVVGIFDIFRGAAAKSGLQHQRYGYELYPPTDPRIHRLPEISRHVKERIGDKKLF